MKKEKSTLLGWYDTLKEKIPFERIPKGYIVSKVLVYDDKVAVEYMRVRKSGKIHYRLCKYDYMDLLAGNDFVNAVTRDKQC